MTYDKDVFGPLPKKKKAVFHHPMGFELYDALAMDLHAMTYAEQCVAAVRAKSAEADLLESLRCACNYIDKLGGVSQKYRAMLAAAPEAKP